MNNYEYEYRYSPEEEPVSECEAEQPILPEEPNPYIQMAKDFVIGAVVGIAIHALIAAFQSDRDD